MAIYILGIFTFFSWDLFEKEKVFKKTDRVIWHWQQPTAGNTSKGPPATIFLISSKRNLDI